MSRASPPTSRLSRATRHVRNPLVAIACAAALTLSILNLPLGPRAYFTSNALLSGRPYTTIYDKRSIDLYLFRRTPNDPAPPDGASASFHILNPNQESWDTATSLMIKRPHDGLIARYSVDVSHAGLWYPSLDTEYHTLTVVPMTFSTGLENWTAADLGQARSAVRAWLANRSSYQSLETPTLLQTQDTVVRHTRRVVPVLINTATLLALLLLPLSLAGLPRYLRVARANRRLRRHQCGNCNYHLAATAAINNTIRCPECGSDWSPADLNRA